MRVLHVVDSGGLYGAEVVLLHLMTEQAKLGMSPILASIGTPQAGEKDIELAARERGLAVEIFRMRPGPNVLGIRNILNFARRESIDLLHSHGYKSNILLGLMPRRLRGFPMISTVHGYTHQKSWSDGLDRMLFYQQLDAYSLRRVESAVLVNGAMREHPLLQRQLKKMRVEVVPNGIPIQGPAVKAELRSEILEFAAGGISIAAVGSISHEKGSDLLLEATAKLIHAGRDLRLLYLGDGVLRSTLESRAAELGIAERILFPGYVNGAGDYLPHIDLFTMPSLTEGLPMVLLEAMLAATPIVATRVGGIPDVLDEGKAGILIPSEDIGALQAGILQVLDQPDEAQKRERAAEARVREFYSSTAMEQGYRQVYEKVLSHGKGRAV
jgi:glycosyltransferase involved in cell wall biosynthesis